MIATVRVWYAGLSRREQVLVGIAGGLASMVILIFGIIVPSLSALDAAETAHDEAVQRRGRIEAAVEAALTLKPGTGVAGSPNIALIVTQGAAEKGFDLMTTANAAAGQVTFRIDQARAPAFLAWLHELESQGIMVSSVTLRGGANGSISVEAQLKQATQ